ncbi:hypothetical protein [Streptomyces sp. NPDC002057]|uniref:hypothetical protein n=1 Tax=Streptomyces sp. NPDC002057 TaxID=3154664 RepID=UPI0033290415
MTKPRQLRVNGEQMVLLPVAEYEKLLASRRQLGGQAARVRTLRDGLSELIDYLERLDRRIDLTGLSPETEDLAGDLRRRLDKVRRVTGLG